MTPVAIVFLVIAVTVVWGGFVASMLYLRAKPQRSTYPAGGGDDSGA